MASGTKLEFVPARQQEAIRSNAARYKIIRPKPPAPRAKPRGLGPVVRYSPSASEASDPSAESGAESDFHSFGSDSMEDSERSDTEDSNAGTEDSDASAESAAEPEFYDLNELATDRGQRDPARIHKSWHAAARAPVGLENRGVTCYQNAAVQALIHLPALGRYLLDVLKGDFPKVSSSSVTVELAQLFKKLTERKSAMFPSKLLRRLEDINPMLDEWQQEDSHEYFVSLLGRLQEDSVPRGEKLRSSIIHDMFGGSVEQKVTCQRCHAVSTTTQDFYDLPVSFSPSESSTGYTLQRSIEDFFTPETIEPHGGSGGYQCEKCKRQTRAIKQIAIAEAPEYLTVHIKRFKMDGHVSKKVKDVLAYPIEMALTRYEKPGGAPLHYKLVSVVVHEGRTVSSGHYIALTRQPNNEWVMYDDETVKKVPESYVRSHESAYILIYTRLKPKRLAKPAKAAPAKAKQTTKQTTKQPAKLAAKPAAKAKQAKAAKRTAKPAAPAPKAAPKAAAKAGKSASSSIDEIFGAKRRKRN